MRRFVCAFVITLSAPVSQADSGMCGPYEARRELLTFYEEVSAYLDSDMEPLLEKRKSGYVWVTHPASPKKLLSSPAGYRRLIQEVKYVAALLESSPKLVCREISWLRKKYEF